MEQPREAFSRRLKGMTYRPTPADLEDLREHGNAAHLAWATTAIAEAWAEVDRLTDSYEQLLADQAALNAAAAVVHKGSIDTKGHHVYVLYGADGAILYIGRSSNILGRLGVHAADPAKAAVRRVKIIRCRDYLHSLALEKQMIQQTQPPLNIAGTLRHRRVA